ncbi:hypothetical protein B0H12DRAFT_1149226 [Mycena haematopus]|nr:hypothetical protein B0H12DRAFT_1149226 [Mycena haematopus]
MQQYDLLFFRTPQASSEGPLVICSATFGCHPQFPATCSRIGWPRQHNLSSCHRLKGRVAFQTETPLLVK